MAGVKVLRKLELGLESTSAAGTLVEASTIWRGTGMIQDTTVTTFVPEDIGNYGGSTNSYIAKYGGEIVAEQDANFLQIGYPLLGGVQGEVAGVADTDSGTAYSYVYTMPTTSANVTATYTFTGGDDAGAETLGYCFCPNFSISGSAGEALKLSSTWRGQQVAPGAFSDTSTLPTLGIETIIFSNGALWIDDDTAAALATTAVSNSLVGMNLDVNTGLQEVFAANATKKFAFTKRVMPEIVLQLTFEHDSNAIAQKAKWRAGTSQQIRLKFIGAAAATPGALLTNFFQVDLAGKFETFDVIGEQDGNDIVTGTFRARYSPLANAAAGLFAVFTVAIDAVSALP